MDWSGGAGRIPAEFRKSLLFQPLEYMDDKIAMRPAETAVASSRNEIAIA